MNKFYSYFGSSFSLYSLIIRIDFQSFSKKCKYKSLNPIKIQTLLFHNGLLDG